MRRWRQLYTVAGFELKEALRSKLVLFVLLLYGLSAAVGSWVFLKALDAAEVAARNALEKTLQVPAQSVPADLVRKKALPGIIASVTRDEELKRTLLDMDPLSIFYGFMALNLVALLVLVTSGGALAADLGRGSARFVLIRCDRLTWLLGKWLGHAGLLAVGLFAGAVAASFVATVQRQGFELASFLWLLRTSAWAFLYGLPFLCLFSSIQILTRSALAARALGLFALLVLSVLHAVTQSSVFGGTLEPLGFLFMAQYKPLLWSPRPVTFVLCALGLLLLGALWLSLGYLLFRRRDA